MFVFTMLSSVSLNSRILVKLSVSMQDSCSRIWIYTLRIDTNSSWFFHIQDCNFCSSYRGGDYRSYKEDLNMSPRVDLGLFLLHYAYIDCIFVHIKNLNYIKGHSITFMCSFCNNV